jgi:hypothetical protein
VKDFWVYHEKRKRANILRGKSTRGRRLNSVSSMRQSSTLIDMMMGRPSFSSRMSEANSTTHSVISQEAGY